MMKSNEVKFHDKNFSVECLSAIEGQIKRSSRQPGKAVVQAGLQVGEAVSLVQACSFLQLK